MAVVYALVLLAALLALLLPTCAIAVLSLADGATGPFAVASRRAARRERRLLDRLDRSLAGEPATGRRALAALDRPGRPTIEALAADLRRLGRLRCGVARTSSVWHDAILLAYDERLRLACRYLGVTEHLNRLGGMDREIERVRVEGELLGVGLVLSGGFPGGDSGDGGGSGDGGSRWGRAA